MKSTKERILDTALTLFNENGLSKVTLRSIAKEMKISQGNLNYHFKKRNEIIETLYFQLVKNISTSIEEQTISKSELNLLFNISKTIMTSFYDFRFFLLDFVQIMRENEVIKIHYFELTKIRKQQFKEIFTTLVGKGVFRKEELPSEYENLYTRFQILGDFWISSATLSTTKISKKTILEYSRILNETIFPYLTETGRKEYFSIIKGV